MSLRRIVGLSLATVACGVILTPSISSATPNPNDPNDLVTVDWLLPSTVTTVEQARQLVHTDHAAVFGPGQKLVVGDPPQVCGATQVVQRDWYPSGDIAQLTADGLLTWNDGRPEDAGVSRRYEFVLVPAKNPAECRTTPVTPDQPPVVPQPPAPPTPTVNQTPPRPADLVTSSVSVALDCATKTASQTTSRRVTGWAWNNLTEKWAHTTPLDYSDTTRRPMTPSELRQCPSNKSGLVNKTFQVDRYMPKTSALAKRVAALDDDRRLMPGEDWKSRTMREMLRQTKWQLITVRVPAKATWNQLATAINAKTSRTIGDIRTKATLLTLKAEQSVTMAWEVTPKSWMIGRNPKKFYAPQIYIGRS